MILFRSKLALLLQLLIIASCDHNTYINGQQKSSIDSTNGTYKTYYINGNTKSISQYRDGKLHGEFVQFYPSGNLEFKCYYVKGILEGETTGYFDQKNSISCKGQYLHGEMDSLWIFYDETGNAIGSTFYEEGRELW